MNRAFIIILLLGLLTASAAQGQPSSHDVATTASSETPHASSSEMTDDDESIGSVVTALYESISGPADETRDWDRFRALFHEAGRLVPMQPLPTGAWQPVVMTPDEFASRNAELIGTHPMFKGKGFYETEAARRTERYGNVATVWSTYEGRLAPDETPFLRGVNTIDLVYDGERWRVLQILWQQETPDLPLPAEYLTTPEGESLE